LRKILEGLGCWHHKPCRMDNVSTSSYIPGYINFTDAYEF
jgi:hypothetical protein